MTQARRIFTVPLRQSMVIYDAAHELVWPERRQPFAGLAKSAKMRKGNYIKAHKCASAALQEALHGGRKGFRKALWFGHAMRDRREECDAAGRA